MIYIQYEKSDQTHTFSDVLVLEDNHTLSEQDIEQIKQTRFQRWLDVLLLPPPIIESIV